MRLRSYTVHARPGAEPVLVREAWSWGAALFGPVWLAWERAWVPAALHAAVLVLLTVLAPGPVRMVVGTGIGVLVGLLGRDLVRWSLGRRGYALTHVVVASDADHALLRLLDDRPDLAAAMPR